MAGEHLFSIEIDLQNKCSLAGCAASKRIRHVNPNFSQRRAGEELASTVRLGGGLAGDRQETGGDPGKSCDVRHKPRREEANEKMPGTLHNPQPYRLQTLLQVSRPFALDEGGGRIFRASFKASQGRLGASWGRRRASWDDVVPSRGAKMTTEVFSTVPSCSRISCDVFFCARGGR